MDYDQLGRLTFITNVLGTFTPTYDGVTGRVLSMQAVNPSAQPVFTSNFQYFGNTNDRRLQQIKHLTPGGSTLSQFDYGYLAEGEITTWTRNLPGATNPTTTYTFGYDDADQLRSGLLQSGGTTLSDATYGYDNAGNRTDETVNGVTLMSNFNATNQMEDVVEKKYFSYDPNGNCTKEETFDRQTLRTFEWDGANRLTAVNVVAGNKRSEFNYDGLGRRAKITEKVNGSVTSSRFYLWCGGEICEERSGTSGETVTKRFFPQGVEAGGTPYYYTRDHLGSIREGLDQSGAVVVQYDYDPWGRQTKLSGTIDADFGYAGYWNHRPSGLNLTWFRAYDPNLARWLSRDPIKENGGLNLYRYVGNTPTYKNDPTGLLGFSLACVYCVAFKAAYWICLFAKMHNPLACLDYRLQAQIWCPLCRGDVLPPRTLCAPPGELPPTVIPPVPIFNLCDLFPGLDGCPGGPNYHPQA